MDKNLDIISYAVSLIIKAAIMAGRFSEKVRRRSLKRLVAMDADTKDKEIIFLKDKIHQLQMQVEILQKRISKQQKKPCYSSRHLGLLCMRTRQLSLIATGFPTPISTGIRSSRP